MRLKDVYWHVWDIFISNVLRAIFLKKLVAIIHPMIKYSSCSYCTDNYLLLDHYFRNRRKKNSGLLKIYILPRKWSRNECPVYIRLYLTLNCLYSTVARYVVRYTSVRSVLRYKTLSCQTTMWVIGKPMFSQLPGLRKCALTTESLSAGTPWYWVRPSWGYFN